MATPTEQPDEEVKHLQFQTAGMDIVDQQNLTHPLLDLKVRQRKVNNLLSKVSKQPKTSLGLKLTWAAAVILVVAIIVHVMHSNSVESLQANQLTVEVRKQIEEGDMLKAYVTLTKLSQIPERMSQSTLMTIVISLTIAIVTYAYTKFVEQGQSHQHASNVTLDVVEATRDHDTIVHLLSSHKQILEARAEELKAKQALLKEQIQTQRASLEAEKQVNVKQLEEKLQKTEQELANTSEDLEQTKSTLNRKQQDLQTATRQVNDERAKSAEIHHELNRVTQSHEMLQEEMNTKEKENQALAERLKETEDIKRKLRHEHEVASKERAEYKAKLDSRPKGFFDLWFPAKHK